jgi:hypothetical protein
MQGACRRTSRKSAIDAPARRLHERKRREWPSHDLEEQAPCLLAQGIDRKDVPCAGWSAEASLPAVAPESMNGRGVNHSFAASRIEAPRCAPHCPRKRALSTSLGHRIAQDSLGKALRLPLRSFASLAVKRVCATTRIRGRSNPPVLTKTWRSDHIRLHFLPKIRRTLFWLSSAAPLRWAQLVLLACLVAEPGAVLCRSSAVGEARSLRPCAVGGMIDVSHVTLMEELSWPVLPLRAVP